MNRLASRRPRGSSAVEYIIAIMLVALTGAGVYKRFGPAIKCHMLAATNSLNGEEAKACSDGAGGSGGDGSGSGGSPAIAAKDTPKGSDGNCPDGLCMLNDDGTSTGCFPAGTTIRTQAGLRPIETITVGAMVLTRDQEDGTTLEWKPVLKAWTHRARGSVRLELADADGHAEVVEPTIDHPFHVDGRGWVAAEELTPGVDQLRDQDGRPLALLSAEERDGERAVYNFTVADDHTYYVGSLGVWVHNGNCDRAVVENAVNNDPDSLKLDPETTQLIKDNGLKYSHANKDWIYLKADDVHQTARVETDRDDPEYWYRSMPKKEYDGLKNDPNHKVPEPPPKSFGGVANHYDYSAGPAYWGNKNDNSVLVEFHAPGLFGALQGQNVGPKGEGGGTYGLGPAGTQPPPKKGKTPKKPKKNEPPPPPPPNVTWQTFNGLLKGWHVVGLRVPNKVP
jgi:Pretoxin HINT domain